MRNIKFDYLKDYIDLENQILLIELNIKRSKRELRRWVEGDLKDVKLTEESRAARLEEIIQALEYEVSLLYSDKEDLLRLVDSFEGLDHIIVKEKYINGKSLESIAYDQAYSYGYIKNRHAELVKTVKFLEKWEDENE